MTPSNDREAGTVREAAERAKKFMQALMDILDPAYDEETGRCLTYHFKIDRMEAESVFHDLREALKPAALSATTEREAVAVAWAVICDADGRVTTCHPTDIWERPIPGYTVVPLFRAPTAWAGGE